MRITRYRIREGVKWTRNYIKKNESKIYKVAKHICRSDVIIDYKRDVLNNIHLIYEPIENHWADTDNITININTCKNFTQDLLNYTILHESLHGMIIKMNKTNLSEYKEHCIMYELDKELI